ncbi:MAG: hypothetical protein JOZ78_02640 [Chroococcidiopsidaceae cyanobacterium CP_BM_ER_R8_30]|nr:hypothetical protein [Chroococcidiopsidaceae cyanobacterium CP_BM_ER_R8_30]
MPRLVLRSLVFLCLTLSYLVRGDSSVAQTKPLTIQTGIQLRELRLSDSDPDKFRANFIIWFSWQPQSGHEWSADKVKFTNAEGNATIKVPIWTKPAYATSGQRFQAMIYEGDFKTFNRYEAFPFDTHYLGIRVFCPKADCGDVNFVSTPQRLTLDSSAPRIFSGWKIAGMEFAVRHLRLPADLNLPKDSMLRLPTAESTLYSFVLRIERELVFGILQIFLPMLLIWLLAYLGLYWEDSSPASRFGASALFAAIAFNLGARFMEPAVPYLTLMSLAFLSLYINILLIVGITTLSFFLRSQKQSHKRVVTLGRWLAPTLVLLNILLLLPVAPLGKAFYSEAKLEHMQFIGR